MNYKLGIDISSHNGNIDFKKVKNAGIEFAVLRTGYGVKHPDQYDSRFEEYYKGCKENGIDVGAYHFSYAVTAEAAEQEADFMLEIVKGKQFEYPLFFDIEHKTHAVLSKAVCAEIVEAFCTRLEKAGYFAGVYSYDSFFFSNLPPEITDRFAAWTARVEDVKPTYCKSYGIWQYSWRGKVDGILTNTDMNRCSKDYPSIIKAKCLNGFTKEIKRYTVAARKEKLSEKDADALAKACAALGMSVDIQNI